MSFKRFVEIGRIGLITYGPDAGKLCTIVDVIDNNRVLVDGPEPITGVHRHALNIKRMQLTDFVIPAKLNASQKCAPACHHRLACCSTGCRGVAISSRGFYSLAAPELWPERFSPGAWRSRAAKAHGRRRLSVLLASAVFFSRRRSVAASLAQHTCIATHTRLSLPLSPNAGR